MLLPQNLLHLCDPHYYSQKLQEPERPPRGGGEMSRTYRILEAKQHHLQAIWRHSGGLQFGPQLQQVGSQLLPVRRADVVSQAADELRDVA